MGTVRLLVVAAAPDARDSTASLRALCAHLAERDDAEVAVWFLRGGDHEPWWDDARVVDDLREGLAGARLLEAAGAGGLAGPIRGRVLRRWWRAAAPDVVLLDDAMGARVIPRGERPVVVVRHNEEPPSPLVADAVGEVEAAIGIGPAAAGPGAPPSWLDVEDLVDPSALRRDADAVDAARREGLDDGLPCIVGWGADGWVDAPDAFVRVLWYLRDRHGREVRGVWSDASGGDAVRRLVADEARRCGLADAVTVVEAPTGIAASGGDVVLLTFRDPAPRRELVEAVAAGRPVVTTAPARLGEPGIRSVAPLDLEAMAAAVHDALGDDRGALAAEAQRRFDVAGFADRLLEAIRAVDR